MAEDTDFKDFTASHLRNVQTADCCDADIPTVKELEKTTSDRMRLLTKAPREVGADGKAKPKPLKERRVMLEKKRWFVTIRNLIDKINENPVENPEVLTKLWESVRKTIYRNLSYCGAITQTPDRLIEDAKCAAELLGIDINAMFKEVSENEYPEPKSWASLKADGTPKTDKPKKAKKSKKTTKAKKDTKPKKAN